MEAGAALPDGSVLVSERDTALVKRIPAGGGAVETVGTVQGVDAGGEGGLLGLAVDADLREHDRCCTHTSPPVRTTGW